MSAFASFNDLARLTDREIQIFLREVDQKDLVVALTNASTAVTQKCLGKMSERVRTFIQEEVDFLGALPSSDVEEVQGRIVQQVNQLVDRGQISWPPGEKKAPTPKAKSKKLGKTSCFLDQKNVSKIF